VAQSPAESFPARVRKPARFRKIIQGLSQVSGAQFRTRLPLSF
jgi:hypothetical protein